MNLRRFFFVLLLATVLVLVGLFHMSDLIYQNTEARMAYSNVLPTVVRSTMGILQRTWSRDHPPLRFVELLEKKTMLQGMIAQSIFGLQGMSGKLGDQREMLNMTWPYPAEMDIDSETCPPRVCPEYQADPVCKRPLGDTGGWVCMEGQVKMEDTTPTKLNNLKTAKQQALLLKADADRWRGEDALLKSQWEFSNNAKKMRGANEDELLPCPQPPRCLNPPPPPQPLCRLDIKESSSTHVRGVVCGLDVDTMVLELLVDERGVGEMDLPLTTSAPVPAAIAAAGGGGLTGGCRRFHLLLDTLKLGYHTVDLFCKNPGTGMRALGGSVNVLKGQTTGKNRVDSKEVALFRTLQDPRRNRQGLAMGLAEILRLRLPELYDEMGVGALMAEVEKTQSRSSSSSSPSPSVPSQSSLQTPAGDEEWAAVAESLYKALEEHLPTPYRVASDTHGFISSPAQLRQRLDTAQTRLASRRGDKQGCERSVALCAIVQNASRTIQEWLTFHLLAGVAHIYIYLNDVSDSTPAMLAPFVTVGFVTVTDWPGESQQLKAYEHCLGVLKDEGEYKWAMVVDADEYMYTVEEGGCVGDFLTRGGFDEYGGVAVNWNYFGDDNRLFAKPREMLVVGAYRFAGPVPYVKTIAQVSKTEVLGIHGSEYEEGEHAVDVRGRRVTGAFNYDYLAQPEGLNLNHYVSMSLEDHLVKRFRGRSASDKYFDLDLFLEFWRRVALDLDHYTAYKPLPLPWVAPWVRRVLLGEKGEGRGSEAEEKREEGVEVEEGSVSEGVEVEERSVSEGGKEMVEGERTQGQGMEKETEEKDEEVEAGESFESEEGGGGGAG